MINCVVDFPASPSAFLGINWALRMPVELYFTKYCELLKSASPLLSCSKMLRITGPMIWVELTP